MTSQPDESSYPIPNVKEVAGWYDFFSRIIADLRGAEFKHEKARRDLLALLFGALRSIHIDYVGMFSELLGDLQAANSLQEIEKAKKTFFRARKKRTKERALAVLDARTLSKQASNPFETRFLDAVQAYVHGRSVEDHYSGIVHNSISREFWSEIADIAEKNELIGMVSNTLSIISAQYDVLYEAFVQIDPRVPGAGER